MPAANVTRFRSAEQPIFYCPPPYKQTMVIASGVMSAQTAVAADTIVGDCVGPDGVVVGSGGGPTFTATYDTISRTVKIVFDTAVLAARGAGCYSGRLRIDTGNPSVWIATYFMFWWGGEWETLCSKAGLIVTAGATEANVTTVGGNVTAIKAKTDNLPAIPADQATLLLVKAQTDLLPAAPANEATGTAIKAKTDLIVTGGATEANVNAVKAKTDLIVTGGATESNVNAVKAKTDLIVAAGATEANVTAARAQITAAQAILAVLNRLGVTREAYNGDRSKLNVYEVSGGALVGHFSLTYDAQGRLTERGEFTAGA